MQGLRARLLVLLLSATVAVLGVALHSTMKIRRESEEQARQSAMHIARLLSVSQEQHLERAYQTLASMSRLPQIARADPTACRRALGAFIEPIYADLGVIGSNGALICSHASLSNQKALADETFFQQALASTDFFIGDFKPAASTERAVLNLAYPIVEETGKARGAIFASINLSWLHQISAAHAPLPTAFNLLDDQGTVLIGYTASQQAILTQRSRLRDILSGPGGSLELADGDGKSRVLAFTPVPGSFKGQKLFVGLDMMRPAGSRERGWLELSVAPIIIVLLITTMAWLGGDFLLVRGFRSLLSVTGSLAAGNLAARSRLSHGRGELGQLAGAFDHLAGSLQRRAQQAEAAIEGMRAQRDRQNALQDITLAITSSLDLSAILAVLLEKLDLFLPYSAATVQLYDTETARLEPIASRNVNEKEWKQIQQEIPWKTGLGLPNVVFETRAPLVVANAQTDPRTMDPVFFRAHGFVSYLGVPLAAKGEILGVLSFYTKTEHRFSNQEIDFLTALAGQAAIAIYNSRLYIRIKNQALELEKSNKIKNEFLAVMSHELRTPLNIIMNYTDMVKGGILGEISDNQDHALGKVSRQSRDLLKMINEILEVAKLEAGTIHVEKREVNVADLLFSLKSEYGDALEKNVGLRWSFPADLPPLQSDAPRLKQILNHLIDNAIKFTDQGTIAVSARLVQNGRAVEFTVRDTGIGISEETIPLIFEKFRQIDSSDSRSYGGIGLGLYLARTYTRMLGGTMEVRSRLGQGAVFTVQFPLQEH